MTKLLPVVLALALAACSDPTPTVPADGATVVPTTAAEPAAAPVEAVAMTVYKTPTCGCCSLWGERMAEDGFAVETVEVADLTAVRDSLGVPSDLSGCHTATVATADGARRYTVEGHVPADAIRRLLAERPDARGLTVPGMPLGSPGMEQGDLRQPYDVLLLTDAGEAVVWESIPGSQG